MAKLKYLLILVPIIIIGVGFVWFWYWFPQSSLCRKPDVHNYAAVNSVVFSPDGKSIAFALNDELYHEPAGICTFPDGGGWSIVKSTFQIFTVSLDNRQPKLVYTISAPNGYDIGADSGRLIGWSDDSIYMYVNISRTNDSSVNTNEDYAINAKTGLARKLSAQEVSAEQFDYEKNMVSPIDNNLWIRINEEATSGISEYAGGVWIYRGNVISLNVASATLVSTIVDSTTLQSLLPPASSTRFMR